MNLKISKEHVLEVAAKYGYDLEFDSEHAGFHYVNDDGNVEHHSVKSVVKKVVDGQYSLHVPIPPKNQTHLNEYKVDQGFNLDQFARVS